LQCTQKHTHRKAGKQCRTNKQMVVGGEKWTGGAMEIEGEAEGKIARCNN